MKSIREKLRGHGAGLFAGGIFMAFFGSMLWIAPWQVSVTILSVFSIFILLAWFCWWIDNGKQTQPRPASYRAKETWS